MKFLMEIQKKKDLQKMLQETLTTIA